MQRRAPTARQLEHMRFIYKINKAANERQNENKGVLGCKKGSHPANARTHESLERRGWIRQDPEGYTHLTPEGDVQLQVYGMKD